MRGTPPYVFMAYYLSTYRGNFTLTHTHEGGHKVRFPIFYLKCKQVTACKTWVRHRHICGLFFDAVAISEAVNIAVDQRVKASVVK
jgi:hypothetical protein